MLKLVAAAAALVLLAGSARAVETYVTVGLDTSSLTLTLHGPYLYSVSGTFDLPDSYSLAPDDELVVFGKLSTSIDLSVYDNALTIIGQYTPGYLELGNFNYIFSTLFLAGQTQSTADAVVYVFRYNPGTPPGADYTIPATLPFTAVVVPEPATWALMLVGVGGMGATLRQRRAVATA